MLQSVAAKSLCGTPLIDPASAREKKQYLDAFSDEFGRQHLADRPLLARLLNIHPGPTPEKLDSPLALLWALHDPAINPSTPIRSSEIAGAPSPLLYAPTDSSIAIEWRTLDELTALHALWNLAVVRANPELQARCFDAARWHIAELQPDNATNHPWAIHVFFELALIEESSENASAARFHAETLLHSCQVKLGRADLVSACILLDAAKTLESVDGVLPFPGQTR